MHTPLEIMNFLFNINKFKFILQLKSMQIYSSSSYSFFPGWFIDTEISV